MSTTESLRLDPALLPLRIALPYDRGEIVRQAGQPLRHVEYSYNRQGPIIR